jgi:hypothetical protein
VLNLRIAGAGSGLPAVPEAPANAGISRNKVGEEMATLQEINEMASQAAESAIEAHEGEPHELLDSLADAAHEVLTDFDEDGDMPELTEDEMVLFRRAYRSYIAGFFADQRCASR